MFRLKWGFAVLVFMAGCASAATPFASYNGEQLYRRFCASCHGKAGYGDGPVAKSFKVMVPDLTRIAQRQGGRFPADRIRKVIDGREVVGSHGSRFMPVWGQEFRGSGEETPDPKTAPQADAEAAREADAIVDRLLEYLRSIQR